MIFFGVESKGPIVFWLVIEFIVDGALRTFGRALIGMLRLLFGILRRHSKESLRSLSGLNKFFVFLPLPSTRSATFNALDDVDSSANLGISAKL